MKRLCIAAVLGFGMASSFAAFAQQEDRRVSVVSFADSPLTVTDGHAIPATPQRVASVSWEVTNVTTRRVDEYMVRVYVYRDDTGALVGYKTTRLPTPVAPGKSGSAFVKFPGELEVRPSDLIVIVITKALFADDTQWEGPAVPEVRERAKAEAARLRGVRPAASAAQPRLQHVAF